jgi:hypothetical protein
MFGPSLLVAPVVTAGATSRSVYLPAGRWLDYSNRTTHYAGAATVIAAAPLGTVPVFVREGAIIPRGDIVQTNNNWAANAANWAPALRIECFPAITGNSSFSYFDGTTLRTIACAPAGSGAGASITITADTLPYAGTFDVYCNPAPTAVSLNGLPTTNFTYDTSTHLLRIAYPAGSVTLILSGSHSIWP